MSIKKASISDKSKNYKEQNLVKVIRKRANKNQKDVKKVLD